jgi:hypothetical protein
MLTLVLLTVSTLAGAEPAWPSASGVYPHLAALAESYSECGIGAVVPWADRLWYVSYVAHKAGEGVGLFEIDRQLNIRRRPESVPGTHAGRMVHRETNQLVIGPYVIDTKGHVRVFDHLARDERVTAIARHLFQPADKVYFQCMEGNYYEGNLRTLELKLLGHAGRELGVTGRWHFKGAYTSQGRYVVANNSYFEEDVVGGTRLGRLAEWDGRQWKILHRTAFCDVTTRNGIDAVPDDRSPLWATGWDKRSVILAVLSDGQWRNYRLPKGSQAYDQAWCTEWPRIRETLPGQWMLDMHGLFYDFPGGFGAGNAAPPKPFAYHLRMTPDFCQWGERLVLAGNENSSMGHAYRQGGQPQSNLWFGTMDELRTWGRPGGWAALWLDDPVRAGTASDPMLIAGFGNRSVHVQHTAPSVIGTQRLAGGFPVRNLPAELEGLTQVAVGRGAMGKPGRAYGFSVNVPVTVYLAVHDRAEAALPPGWQKTAFRLAWEAAGPQTDTVYLRKFPAGRIEIPAHAGRDASGRYGVPHLCLVKAQAEQELTITGLTPGVDAVVRTAQSARLAPRCRFMLQIDRDGTDRWNDYTSVDLAAGASASVVLPEGLAGAWLRVVPSVDTVATAQLVCVPGPLAPNPVPERFAALTPAREQKPRVHGAMVAFARRLWMTPYVTDADGRPREGLGLYEMDQDMKPRRRAESVPGLFANRVMLGSSSWLSIGGGLLSIGPHLIDAQGQVRTFSGLAKQELVASLAARTDARQIQFLTADGRLLRADPAKLQIVETIDLRRELKLSGKYRFKSGFQAGPLMFVTAVAEDGPGGLLAEGDGHAWKIVDRAAYAEVTDLASMNPTVVATGWDAASALLKLREASGWTTFRLPKVNDTFEQALRIGLPPRIREVETERLLVDVHGINYESTGLRYAWFLRPVAAHGRLMSDFASWRGLTLLAGSDADAPASANCIAGPGGLRLWLGKTDDLWQLADARSPRRPTGVGGPWRETPVRAGAASDPYLMTNFVDKRVELRHDAASPVRFTILVNAVGDGRHYAEHATVTVGPGKSVIYQFPTGFGAHWARLKVDQACKASARFVYQ